MSNPVIKIETEKIDSIFSEINRKATEFGCWTFEKKGNTALIYNVKSMDKDLNWNLEFYRRLITNLSKRYKIEIELSTTLGPVGQGGFRIVSKNGEQHYEELEPKEEKND